MFIAALFTIVRSWKQPKCPSTDKCIKKMWYLYTMEYYSTIKRNEIGSFVEMWMDLEPVIWSKVSQKEKNKYHILMHIYVKSRKMIEMNQFARQKSRHRCREQMYGHQGGKVGVGVGSWEKAETECVW